ncbi:hypothetical protein I0C86_26300 [Plantactinospora sp. S1510]|uniref:Uncharacterized protein n=1 Tax=Plantactinospora alkalitolerans TaxID=2789879 RepID=A0ABS0H272_9ACTN|nr:hypothetical protein [Plantactinospora alkalitolerans]MBF9132434.1 hypothetical protein [Plantactinospora alkalitolerans]
MKKSRSLPVVAAPGSSGAPPSRRGVVREQALVESPPHEPLAVIAVGPAGGDRRAVLAGLLGGTAPPLRAPVDSFMVIDYAQAVTGAAYVPGLRSAREYRTDPIGAGPALGRPPRRIELTVPDPLLRHFTLVDAPDTRRLGMAGIRVVRDAVRRGGALLFVLPDDEPVTTTELDLLTEVAGEAAVFPVGTPGTDGTWSPVEPGPRRAALVAAVPALAGVRWIDLDPAAADTAYLRRALVDWASAEGLRRASLSPPIVPGATRTVRVAADAETSGWADRLDRQVRTCAHRLRREIALETANVHLRGVQEIVSGSGAAGLPHFLDREVEALSLEVVAACDAGVDRILGETLTVVFGEVPDEGVRLRVAAAVGWGLAADPAAQDLDRVLLLRESGTVEAIPGLGAVAGLAAYPGGTGGAILPPLGVGLSGGCYQYWRNPARSDPIRARSWLRRSLREIELELSREVSRRFEAVGRSLTSVLTEAVRHGRLLA